MIRKDSAFRLMTGTSLMALTLVSVGCAHVGREDFDTESAQGRDEMRAGDEQVSSDLNSRIDGVEGRVAATEQEVAALERDIRALEQELIALG